MDSKDRRLDVLTQLSDGIAALTDSAEWLRHLDAQSRFHRYSFGNVVLIASQFPAASRVAGFHAWKKLGRSVAKGEKAIWILAPMTVRKGGESDDERVVRGFKHVPVFDISQTEGEDLPAVCHKLTGDEPAASLGYSVEPTELRDGVNGDCTFNLRRIRVEVRNASAQRAKTLAHEIAHALLHSNQPDHQLAELEAESTAYVVCSCLGLDTSSYSFGYVASWAGGGEQAVTGIKASCSRIQEAAALILDALEVEEQGEGISEAA
jgi:antirestriction protein ArdC